jgi:hypothetical protein
VGWRRAGLPDGSENRRLSTPNPRQDVATRPAGKPLVWVCGRLRRFAHAQRGPIEVGRLVKRNYEVRKPRKADLFSEQGKWFLIPSLQIAGRPLTPTTSGPPHQTGQGPDVWYIVSPLSRLPHPFHSALPLLSRILSAEFKSTSDSPEHSQPDEEPTHHSATTNQHTTTTMSHLAAEPEFEQAYKGENSQCH